MGLMTYFSKDRHGTYYFRKAVPPSLRPFMPGDRKGNAVWKRSLKTKDAKEAKKLAARLLHECDADFAAAEHAMQGKPATIVSPLLPIHLPKAKDIEADFHRTTLDGDDQFRSEGDARRIHQTPTERRQWPDLAAVPFSRRGMEEVQEHVHRDQLADELTDYKQALSRGDITILEPELRAYFQERGVAFDPQDRQHYDAGIAALRGTVRAYGDMKRRLEGDVIETPEPIKPIAKGPRLSEAFAGWKVGSPARGGKKPGANSIIEAGYVVRRVNEMFPNDPFIADITKEEARAFRDALAKCPKALPASLKKLPLPKLIANKEASQLPMPKASTVNKTMQQLISIISHAEQDGRFDALPAFTNPFRKLKLALDDRFEEGRLPFDGADLKVLFGTDVFRAGKRPAGGAGEAAFWVPIIGLLTGARLGEIAQLRIQDLRQDPESGIWFIDIGTTGGRTTKTASSRRTVPLHHHLIALGLPEYRAWVASHSEGPEASLWPDLAAPSFSKWFNRSLEKAGIDEPGKVFHSFRHTFKDLARDAGIPEDMHDALTGHSGGGVGRSYGRGASLRTKKEAIDRITIPKALEGLAWAVPAGGALKRKRPRVPKRKLGPRQSRKA